MKQKIMIGIIAVFFMISLIAPLTKASEFEFTTIGPPDEFNTKENETFKHFVNVTGNEGKVEFSSTAHDSGTEFDSFSMGNYSENSSLINFTPKNEDVGKYEFFIIAKDTETNKSITTEVSFTVENLNTPPEIVSYSPQEPVVAENSSIMLYLNATDDDIIHGSNLTYNWFLNGKESSETDGKLEPERININRTKAEYFPKIEDFDAGMNNVTVVVEDWENETAIHTWDVNVTNVNRKPEFIKEIGDFEWEENTNLTGENGLNLTKHFNHPDTNGTLEIVTTGFELDFDHNFTDDDFENITIDIVTKDTNKTNATAFAEFYPEENWFGKAEVEFYVYDGYNEPVYSNPFKLEVVEVYEPPEVEPIEDQTAYRFADFFYSVEATDHRSDNLDYYIEIIESETLEEGNVTIDDEGLIEFYTEDEDHIGNHTLNVTVENEHDLNTSEIFELEVKNNTRPVIHELEDLSVYQHNFSYFNVTGEDDFSETINFTTNLSGLPSILNINDDELNLTSKQINNTARNFSFKPIHQKLVDNHTVAIYAEDEFGAKSNSTFELEIINVPTPPNISKVSVPNNQIKVNTSFNHTVEAFDMEGNIEEFSDNTSLFNITTIDTGSYNRTATGEISFTPNETGFHQINISVNDSDGQEDWTIFELNITQNHAPELTSIRNITTTRTESYSQDVQAEVFDWQDELELHHNAPGDIGSITIGEPEVDEPSKDGNGDKKFTWSFELEPESYGDYTFDVWVTDGKENDTRTLTANISDVPTFNETLSEMEEWNNLIERTQSIINITAESQQYTENGKELDMTASVINFTGFDGTFYNKTEFEDEFSSFYEDFSFEGVELDDENKTRGTLDFTPEFENAGKYWVNISAADDNTVTSEIFSFDIEHITRPIVINWSYEYPAGQGYTDFSNESDAFINCKENETINFNMTINNPNKMGMNFTWYEIKDSNQTILRDYQTNSSFEEVMYSYDIPFYAHPNITLKFVADDGNAKTNVSWVLNASNVNRDVVFGKKPIEFSEEKGQLNNTLVEDGNLVLDEIYDHDLGDNIHYENGSYISPSIDIGLSNSFLPRFYYDEIVINDLNETYDKYNITYYTATGNDKDFTPTWERVENKKIQSDNLQYIMFKAEIEAKNSSVTNVTPALRPQHIKYNIPDQKEMEGTDYGSWIDLKDYFYDPDGTELNYSYEFLEGEENANVFIRDDGSVELNFDEEGVSIIQFSAKDEFNSTAYTNEIEIETEPAEGGGEGDGDGTETRVVTETKTETVTEYETEYITETKEREVEEPVALNIIHPEDVTIHENETMTVPIALENEDKFTLHGLDIDAYPEDEGLNVSLDREYIEELEQNSQEEINLEISMLEIQQSYNVVVEVTVNDPEYEDSAKILISPLTRAREGEEDAQLRMAFVRDLLEKHEECGELEQYVGRATEYIEEGNHGKANELLDEFINDCRVLIEKGGIATDQPGLFGRDIISYIREDTELLVTLISIASLTIITLIAGLTIGYRRL